MKNIVKRYLELSGFSELKNSFEDHFLSHPNYPSLYAVTDSLSFLEIENVAAKVGKDDFDHLPDFFLTLLNGGLVLVNTSKKRITVENESGEIKQYHKEEFMPLWEGIILVVEKKENVKGFVSGDVARLGGLLLSLVLFFLVKNMVLGGLFLEGIIVFVLVVLGLASAVFIAREKTGTGVASKFCSSGSSVSCENVVNSVYSKLIGKLEISDLPIIYFSSATIALLLNIAAYSLVTATSTMALPWVVYSLWLQKVKIKKWCPLCLMVGLVLLLISVLFFAANRTIDVSPVFDFMLIVSLVAFVWFLLKESILSGRSYRTENFNLRKLKRNPDVFFKLLEPIHNPVGMDEFVTFDFGIQNAVGRLTLLLSPGCSHCHTAYQKAVRLHKRFPDKVMVRVLYNVNPFNNSNEYKDVALTLMEWNKVNPGAALKAMDDWHEKGVGLNEWLQKWNITINDVTVRELESQYEWCQGNQFNYAPVRLFNEKLLPNEYELDDLAYFINDINSSDVTDDQTILLQR